jgi:hypothetical protein
LRPSLVQKDLLQPGNAQGKYAFIMACSSLYDVIYARWRGLRSTTNTPTSCMKLLEKGSGLSEKVAAISKWKMNLQMCIYKQRQGL